MRLLKRIKRQLHNIKNQIMDLKIVTPISMLNFLFLTMCACPGSNGSFGIMTNHQNGIFQLNIGEIKVMKDGKRIFATARALLK